MKATHTTEAYVVSGYQAEGDPVKGRIAVLRVAWVQRVKVVVNVKNPKRAYKMTSYANSGRSMLHTHQSQNTLIT